MMTRYKWSVVVMVAALGIVSMGLHLHSLTKNIPTIAQLNNLPTIIIDPGHGGIDGGAVGVDDIVEKDINLEISLFLQDIFAVSGFEVVMIRETDISIHDEGVTGVKNQKVSDLHNRLAIAQQYPNAVFISVHQNKFGESSSHGTQIFYSPNHLGSQRLAELLQAAFVRNLQPDNNPKIKEAGDNLYLMTKATCPAVLVECGFLSNYEEAYQLVDAEYQAKLAFTIYAGTMQYLEMDQPVAPNIASA